MNKDVEVNMERLLSRYRDAQATVDILRSSDLPTGRAATRAHRTVTEALGILQEGRKAPSKAVVRLAYVRALRETKPGSTMTPEQEREVDSLWYALDRALGSVEWQALVKFRGHVRRNRVIQAVGTKESAVGFVQAIQAADQSYPLELRARVSVLEVLEQAAAAGSLAGTQAGDYDGAE